MNDLYCHYLNALRALFYYIFIETRNTHTSDSNRFYRYRQWCANDGWFTRNREMLRGCAAMPRSSSTSGFNVHLVQGCNAAIVNGDVGGDKDAKYSTWKHWYFLQSIYERAWGTNYYLTRGKMIRPWQLALKRAPISARCRRCFCVSMRS